MDRQIDRVLVTKSQKEIDEKRGQRERGGVERTERERDGVERRERWRERERERERERTGNRPGTSSTVNLYILGRRTLFTRHFQRGPFF